MSPSCEVGILGESDILSDPRMTSSSLIVVLVSVVVVVVVVVAVFAVEDLAYATLSTRFKESSRDSPTDLDSLMSPAARSLPSFSEKLCLRVVNEGRVDWRLFSFVLAELFFVLVGWDSK